MSLLPMMSLYWTLVSTSSDAAETLWSRGTVLPNIVNADWLRFAYLIFASIQKTSAPCDD
jgi:hypothetical protein